MKLRNEIIEWSLMVCMGWIALLIVGIDYGMDKTIVHISENYILTHK